VAGACASAEAAPRDAGRWLAYALEHVRFGDAAAVTGPRAVPALACTLAAGQARVRAQGRRWVAMRGCAHRCDMQRHAWCPSIFTRTSLCMVVECWGVAGTAAPGMQGTRVCMHACRRAEHAARRAAPQRCPSLSACSGRRVCHARASLIWHLCLIWHLREPDLAPVPARRRPGHRGAEGAGRRAGAAAGRRAALGGLPAAVRAARLLARCRPCAPAR